MHQPVIVTIPHKLGRAEAKQRIAGGIGKLRNHIPGGAADVASRWDGDRLMLDVRAMGQVVAGTIEVEEQQVRLELRLPAFLAMFARQIEAVIARQGAEMLEDKRSG